MAVAALILLIGSSVFAGEKLKIFILSGQSNMVGHAKGPHHRHPVSFRRVLRDKANSSKLVFEEGNGLSKKIAGGTVGPGKED